MTKTTYLIAAVLLLAACTQDEQINRSVNGSGERIIFRTSLPEVTSRASSASIDNIEEIHVTAFNPDDPEWKDANGKLGEYVKNAVLQKKENYFTSEDCLWPPQREHEDDQLHFFAFYPDLNAGATLVNATTVSGNATSFDYKINNFRVATNIADQVDFVTAYGKGSMDNNLFSGINLEFKHKLGRIEVKAKSSNKSCKIEIAGIRIGGIHTLGTYNFKAEDGAGYWTIDENQEKENVEYFYRPGDKVVTLDNTTEAVSIMGGSDGINYAMLLPSSYTGWNFGTDNTNSHKGMFISVLLRVLDKTPGGNDKQHYPYFDTSQGLNAMNIPRVYLAVRSNGIVNNRLYKKNNSYFSDEACTQSYTLASGEEVKEFGWAALPVTGNWEAGYSYTYTLDYTSGVGVHDPSVGGTDSPRAGDPIISDRVGISVSVNEWQTIDTDPTIVPGS